MLCFATSILGMRNAELFDHLAYLRRPEKWNTYR